MSRPSEPSNRNHPAWLPGPHQRLLLSHFVVISKSSGFNSLGVWHCAGGPRDPQTLCSQLPVWAQSVWLSHWGYDVRAPARCQCCLAAGLGLCCSAGGAPRASPALSWAQPQPLLHRVGGEWGPPAGMCPQHRICTAGSPSSGLEHPGAPCRRRAVRAQVVPAARSRAVCLDQCLFPSNLTPQSTMRQGVELQ